MRVVIAILCLGFAGCATRHRDAESASRAYERGYAQAVKEQYWIIQNLQRQTQLTNPQNP